MPDLAPWEEAQASDLAPWEEAQASDGGKDYEEVMHPAITFKERALAKNLSQSPEATVRYLTQEHPELEVKTDGKRYFIKDKGKEGKFKVLDPDTGMISKDIIGDIADIGWDILSGGVETAAGIGGALGGAAATPFIGGAGAIPGAMAASSATTAGMEAARQKIGQLAGIPQEVSGTDVAISGGIGAVSPLLFGTGAGAGQLAKAGVKKGIAKFGEKGVGGLAKEGAGRLMGGAYDVVAKHIPAKAAEVMSGISSKVYKDYIENPAIIKQIDKAKGMAGYAETKLRNFYDKLNATKKKISTDYDQLQKADIDIDISNVKNQLIDLRNSIAQGQKTEGLNKDQIKLVSDLDKMYKDLFEVTVQKTKGKGKTGKIVKEELGDQVKAKKVLELKKILKKYEEGYKDITRSNKSAFDKTVVTKARGLNAELSNQLEKKIPNAGNIADAWGDVLDDYEFLETELKNKMSYDPKFRKEHVFDKKGKKYLKGASIDSEEGADRLLRLQEMDQKYGTDLTKTSNMLKSYDQLRKAPTWPLSGGATSTTRTLGGAALGGLAGSQAGEGYPVLGTALGAIGGSPKIWKGALMTGQAPRRMMDFLGEKQFLSPYMKQTGVRTGIETLKPRERE